MMKPADYDKMADDCDRIANGMADVEEQALLRSFAERLRREADELRRRAQDRRQDDG